MVLGHRFMRIACVSGYCAVYSRLNLTAGKYHSPEYLRHHDQRQQAARSEQRTARALHAGCAAGQAALQVSLRRVRTRQPPVL